MKNIKMVDLQNQYLEIKEEVDEAISDVLNNTNFINGTQVRRFADNLGSYCGVRNVIPCGNGTDALQLAMMALGFNRGDEVIVPVHTYVATAEVIALLNLTPVFVDVDPNTFTLDPELIRDKITSKTVGIVPVHLYGQCADMESIMQIADEFDLKVIEDTAQALSAEYIFSDGSRKKAGTIGHIGTTSFFPSKNLGCYGDGGALLVNDDEIAKTCQMMANHGQSKKYHHDLIGCNSRLDTIQAAVLDIKLKRLDQYSGARQRVAEMYDASLGQIPQIQIPTRYKKSTHVYHQYTIKIIEGNRNDFKNFLLDKGIPSMIYYPVPLHLQHAYKKYCNLTFSISEELSKTVLSLPIHTEMEETQQKYIIDNIFKYFN